MILLVNPRATRPKNRRFPLSVMAIGAALPEHVSWEIVDGNRPGRDAYSDICGLVDARQGTADPVRLIGISVMPGPQVVSAVPLTQRLKSRYPAIPIVWGGNFPSLYPGPVVDAPYVDWAVRGQGEHTFLELLDVIEGGHDPRSVAGLAFRDGEERWIGPERSWVGPDDLPPPPYHRIDVADYIHPTFLGRRSAVYQASMGCPYSCRFCGVISVYGSRQKVEDPARTERHLRYLVEEHGVDGLHFYDNNFFLGEARAVELAERMSPLGLSWWCEARIDAMLRFSDSTWRKLVESGLKAVFFGAESGSDDVLRAMSKDLTTDQTLEIAARTREHGIIPEFSFVLGGPEDPAGEIDRTLDFVRKLKSVNPRMELVTYFYTPTPQRGATYGGVDPLSGTPARLEDWTRPEWVGWMTHENPEVPWMTRRLKARVEDFALVLRSRFPSIHDEKTRPWGQMLAKLLSAPRWTARRYGNPRLIRAVRRWARASDDRQAYGHLRPSAPGQG